VSTNVLLPPTLRNLQRVGSAKGFYTMNMAADEIRGKAHSSHGIK
jgi:hypothetical protein